MAGVECLCPRKRKVEDFTGEECSRAPKRMDCSEGENKAAAAGYQGEEAAAKKMWRLPQEEINWILAQGNEPICPKFRDLKRANPSLVPSPEEEKDESMVLLYAGVREWYENEEKFAVFHAWVHSEYTCKGYVEVDYDYFGERAEATKLIEEAREEVFRNRDLYSDSEDDDVCRLSKRTVRSYLKPVSISVMGGSS